MDGEAFYYKTWKYIQKLRVDWEKLEWETAYMNRLNKIIVGVSIIIQSCKNLFYSF